MRDPRVPFERVIAVKAERHLAAQRAGPPSVWSGLGVFGVIGWSVVIPTLAGTALGVWLDRGSPGRYSWTLWLMLAGLFLGSGNAWRWLSGDGEQR